MRYSGQVVPNIPDTAPLALRLPEEVYALDGCCCPGAETGPPVGPVDVHTHALSYREESARKIDFMSVLIGLGVAYVLLR